MTAQIRINKSPIAALTRVSPENKKEWKSTINWHLPDIPGRNSLQRWNSSGGKII